MMGRTARLVIGGILVVVAGLLLFSAFSLPPGSAWSGLLMNAGTEILGIVVTVLGIEWVVVAQHHKNKARAISLAASRDLDRVVWCWLGGHRRYEMSETAALLYSVTEKDPVADCVQNMLMELAGKAEHTRRVETETLRKYHGLEKGLTCVAALLLLPDAKHQEPSIWIRDCLIAGMGAYMNVLDYTYFDPGEIKTRDSSIEGQEQRCNK